ncbi:sigma-70 family RNA polymerase sigma factor [Dactylosporangium sp. NPDC049742]|uniref:RNA polymerase sigma factor n=1 Tax=Dactylosporangium sp. NPDC049742 TaxID=3154737 RepID=UPI00341F07BB
MEPDDAAARRRFEELFEAHYAELTRFATRRVGADAAGDIVAGTFLIAWRRLGELPPDHARAWLYSTARQVIANELRGRTRLQRLTDKAAAGGEVHAADHSAQVDEQLRVRAVLAELSPADQEVLRLIEWEGLDVAEAALVLRCTRTALKVRLHRARRRFAQRLLAADEQDTSTARRTRPSIVPQGSTSP